MKTKLITNLLCVCIFTTLIYSCSSQPSNEEILNLVNINGFLLKKEIILKGDNYKVRDTEVFAYTIYVKYIIPGLTYGYVNECPEAQCCKDLEYEEKRDYLIYKNEWNKWDVFESKQLENKEIQVIWRPSSFSQEQYYKDYIQ